MSSHGAWQPLLNGPLAAQAREAALAIAEALREPPAAANGSALAFDTAGFAVMHAYLARTIGGEAHRTYAGRAWDAALEAVADESLDPSLYGGFAGVAWATEQLQRQLA